jgi:hypothetical protein
MPQLQRTCSHRRDLLGNLLRRLAPSQIFVNRSRCDIDCCLRQAAEIKRRTGLLLFDANMFAFKVDGLAGEQRGVYDEKLTRYLVTFVVIEKDAIALVLGGITAGDIDQASPCGLGGSQAT